MDVDVDVDVDDIFRDEDEADSEFYQKRESSREYVVHLIDASPKMFSTVYSTDAEKNESHFHIAVSSISQVLKTQIINRSFDEVSICFFNTREKKNLQDLHGVFVFKVSDRDDLDRPTAKFIRDFDCIEESFMKQIGSQYGIVFGSRENSIYNALWVAQALLRKGSAKTIDKRILLFTNEDDPFGCLKGVVKTDMTRTTLQRAKDAQDLGISIELLPLSRHDKDFDVSYFYADLIGLEGDELAKYVPSAGQKLVDMKDQLRKKMFTKRIVKRVAFIIAGGVSIDLNMYALLRQTVPGAITWLDSITNRPLKIERSYICEDTGALLQEPEMRFQSYNTENINFSIDELSKIKRVSTGHLRLIGFKPLSSLKDYHNLRPSTFVFASDKEIIGSTCVFIALLRSMLRLKRYAVAFYGGSLHPHLVALVAQDEIISAAGQVDPPGLHMIYLPYSDDVRQVEELNLVTAGMAPRASDDHIKKASALIKRIDLKDFSVFQFANPALQRHYAVLQALALGEDEVPEITDETLPDEEGMARDGVVKAAEEFRSSICGGDEQEECERETNNEKAAGASKKRKAISEDAIKGYSNYDWADLANNGKLNSLTMVDLKHYLMAHDLPVTGKKEALITKILTHMGKLVNEH